MATFTITSSINIDALPAKTGSDTYNINGGYLTVDQDSRYGYNQHFSGVLGNITLSPTLGGTIEFNATMVRIVPFINGTGNVPPYNTIIVSGSAASGTLIGVYPNLGVAPLNVGQPMSGSGYIKIKQWNSQSFGYGSLTGISAWSSGTDAPGWIEVVGLNALTCTVNRLNTFKVRGEWFEISSGTSGINTTTYQIPSNGNIVHKPGVWVETDISGTYEFYPCAGTLAALTASMATDEVRGKVCWISTAGLLRFKHDGTNSTGGYLPPAGRRVRIPNVFFSTCAGGWAINQQPNAVLATRYDFTTTGGGVIDIDKASMNWYPIFQQPFSVTLTNTGIMTQLLVSEIASPLVWSNVGVGQEAANSQIGLSMATCFAGGTITDSTFTCASQGSGIYGASLTDLSGFTFTRVKMRSMIKASNAAAGSYTLTRVANSSWVDCTFGAGRALITTCNDLNFSGTIYFDNPNGSTLSAIPMYVWDIASNCARLTFNGLSFGGLNLAHPYSGILNVGAAGCTDIKLRNLGTPSASLDMGAARVDDAPWTRVTTTATVTSSNHGLKANDIIYAVVTSDPGTISVAAKTVVSALDANRFTFACTAASSLTGSICYYPTMAANLFVLAAGAAANDVEVKRCYTPHLRTNLYTADNSTKNVLIENVVGDYINAPVVTQLNGYHKGVFATLPMTAGTSVYGSHWFDIFTGDIPVSQSSVSWSRLGAVAYITSSAHALRTNVQINVITSSQTGTLTLGRKTITAISSSVFTFACVAGGPTVGTLSFNDCSGRIGLLMNEATSETSSSYTLDAGTPQFTSAGGLYMPTIGQQITFETPNYIIGHTSFPVTESVMAGAAQTNFTLTYALDKNDGAGYGSFRNLSFITTGAGGSSGSQNVTMADTTGVEVGDYIFGTNIAPNSFVTSIVNGTTVSTSLANTGVPSGLLRFCHLPGETDINSYLGFKMKIRILTRATNTTAITSLYVLTRSTPSSRAYQYPLDLVPLTITNLRNPSEVRVFPAGETTSIAGQEDVTNGTFTTTIDAGAYPYLDIAVLSLGYQNLRYTSQALGSGLTLQAAQVIDRQYDNS